MDKKKKYGQENNNFIFESRLAWYFIQDSIKIKLIGEFDERVKRVGQRDEENIKKVKIKTIEHEISEKRRYSNSYNIEDYTDDSHYDLIIDSTNKNPEILCSYIEKYINSIK